jgi:hypothetical protein
VSDSSTVTILVGLSGAAATIAAVFLSNYYTRRRDRREHQAALDQERRRYQDELELEKSKLESQYQNALRLQHLQEASQLISDITHRIMSMLTPIPINEAEKAKVNNWVLRDDELRLAELGSKALVIEGGTRSNDSLTKLGDRLAVLLRDYWKKIDQFYQGRIPRKDVDIERENVKSEIIAILAAANDILERLA